MLRMLGEAGALGWHPMWILQAEDPVEQALLLRSLEAAREAASRRDENLAHRIIDTLAKGLKS